MMLLAPATAGAQRWQPEVRVDVIGPAPASLEPGLGITRPLGTYVRVGAAAGYDVLGERSVSARTRGDLIARVTLDPFRQERVALSIGGGVSYRDSRLFLAVVLDLEGPRMAGLMPALQLGASGGLRAGVILRRALPDRR